MSRNGHTHLKNGERTDRFHADKMEPIAYCGSDRYFDRFTDNMPGVDCPTCSMKWAKAQIAPLGVSYRLEREEKTGLGIRSRYRLFIGDDEYASLELGTGRYGRWNAITMDKKELLDNWAKRVRSKEHAALVAIDAYLRGELRSRTVVDKEQDELRVKYTERLRQARNEEAEQKALDNQTLADLLAVRDGSNGRLTNHETAVVSEAIALLQRLMKA